MAAARKAKTPEFTAGRFQFNSQKQLDFFTEVMERNELTIADVEARYPEDMIPSKWGFQVLDKLLQIEADEKHAAKVGLPPTQGQLDAVLYYRGLALDSGRKGLAVQLKELHESIADRAAMSLALGACQRIWPKDAPVEETPSVPNTEAGFGDEEFGK